MKKKIIGAGIAVFIMLIAALPTNANNSVKSVKEAAEIAENELLMVKEGITGISWTEDPPRVIVMIESEEYRSIVPDEIAGFKTEIEVTGEIRALGLAEPQSILLPQLLKYNSQFSKNQVELESQSVFMPQLLRKSRHSHWDIQVGGISVGTNWLTNSYGTLAVCTIPGPYILSCTHVIAMNMNGGHLPPGIAVIQPGLYDGGGSVIGHLKGYIIIKYGGIIPNYADAAIAWLEHSAHLNAVLGPDDINTYSVSLTAVVPSVGQTVRKSGATSAVTQNKVTKNSATILVRYGTLRWARFKDVIEVQQPFVEGGDSGSFVDLNGNFVGLAFAASGYYGYGYVCKASYIKSALGI